MLRVCAAAAVLAAATADSFDHDQLAEWEATLRRALQQGGRPQGAGDLSICARPNSRNLVSAATGTIHDDQTDEAVDCSGGCNGGYGDNLDCYKTITAPPGATITLEFTNMALENGHQCGDAHGGVGCDVVTVFDGPTTSSPVLGTFSGTQIPPPLMSTSNTMTVRFETDTGNFAEPDGGYGGDPGFYADWHFDDHLVTHGDGICPAPAEYTAPQGTIHDDARSGVNCAANPQQCGSGSGDAGYADNTHCYTTIHAPETEQVRFTFTQMNLEKFGCHQGAGPTWADGQDGAGCPDGGCDYVIVFDGQTTDSPVIGKYSGYLTGADLPSIVSTGSYLRVEFHTDNRNCGISSAEDPGWFADWAFVEDGQNICDPDAAVLHAHHGVLHDDDVSTATSYQSGGAGYGDNLDCGVRIRAPKHGVVNFHILQMSLEGDGYGICDENNAQYIGHSCDDNGGDFLYIYDGRNADAPLLGQLNGMPADAVYQQDTFTSTGRDLYVRFETDSGNYGLTNTLSSPGFYAEWNVVEDGADCVDFQETPGHGLIGHNNERLENMTPQQCMEACCARPWCMSFDYMAGGDGGHLGTEGDGLGTCNLADIDASTSFGSIGVSRFNDFYERPSDTMPANGAPLGPTGCAAQLAALSEEVTATCCPDDGCSGRVPPTCSEECADLWLPFSKQCSIWLESAAGAANLAQVTQICEREEYGKYRPGNHHGRCSDGDFNQYQSEFAPACCGAASSDSMQYCPDLGPGESRWTQPTSNDQPICTPSCAAFMDEVYAECQPRFQYETDPDTGMTLDDIVRPFIMLCQGMTSDGGGHRRQLDDASQDTVPHDGKKGRLPVVTPRMDPEAI